MSQQQDTKSTPPPQTATPNTEICNPQIKVFLYGSIGLIALAAITFIVGSMWLLFKPNNKPSNNNKIETKKELNIQPTIDKNAQGPNLLVTKAPERQKITHPPITFIDPQIGSQDAPITIIEFSDFNCPYCAEVQATLAEIFKLYPDKIRLVWKNLPITQLHPTAGIAAQAALCAGEQNNFWEYHDLLFANQMQRTNTDLANFAEELSLNINSFSSCLSSSKMKPRIDKTLQEAEDLLINGTPHFYINKQEISGAADLESFVKIIELELGTNKQ